MGTESQSPRANVCFGEKSGHPWPDQNRFHPILAHLIKWGEKYGAEYNCSEERASVFEGTGGVGADGRAKLTTLSDDLSHEGTSRYNGR